MNSETIDCLLIGYNDSSFADYLEMTRSMGASSGAFRDLNLAFIDYQGEPFRSMDILNHFYAEKKGPGHQAFHNMDFMWPVITYLGSYLDQRGFTFDYVNLFHIEKDKLREKLQRNNILTIAVTTTLYVSPYPILEVMSFIKQYNDSAKIILGGPYISNQAKMTDAAGLDQLFSFLGADFYVISSEGEMALVRIIEALKKNAGLDSVDNIAYRKGADYIMTAASVESNALEGNPVNYRLFPREEFGEFVTLRTAKSCPFTCSFCGFPQRAGQYTYLSVDLVEKELNAVREIGTVTTLTFIDDTFNVPKGRFKDILRMMIRNGYGFKWNSYLRSDHVDEEALDLMAASGCEGVFLGAESGSDTMLERMNKTSRRKHYMKVIPMLRDRGISTYTSLIVGFPGETYESNQETLEFIEESAPDFFRTQLWYCDPTTPIWKEREKYGVKGSAFNWTHDTMDVETACDLIERAFLCIKNSIWLPQNGFDQWSTFYLQRKGMTMEQIKTFLRAFNAIVKHKLINPDEKEIKPDLLESLRLNCEFDEPHHPDMHPALAVSGERYLAAEDYLAQAFGGEPALSNLELIRGEATGQEAAKVETAIEKSLLDQLSLALGVGVPEVVLAAYSVLLSRLNGRADTPIVAVFSKPQSAAAPLRLYPAWELSFSEFARTVGQNVDQSLSHAGYAFHILNNPARMARRGCSSPTFDVAYIFGESNGESQKALAAAPAIALTLKAAGEADRLKLEFNYQTSSFSPHTVEKLSAHLVSILRNACGSPQSKLEQIALEQKAQATNLSFNNNPLDTFQF